jgi:hypothetical protein
MIEHMSGQWELRTGSEEPEAYGMVYIRHKFAAKTKRSAVAKRSDRAVSHGYQ